MTGDDGAATGVQILQVGLRILQIREKWWGAVKK